MKPPDVALGVDLHKSSTVCYAVCAGDGEPPEWLQTLLDDLDNNHRLNGAEPQNMHMIVQTLRGCNIHVLIENPIKTFDTYWVPINLGCHINESIKKTDRDDSMELAAYMRRRLHEENKFAECVMPSKGWMMRREICRTIFSEKSHLGDLKKRVRSHVLLHWIRLSCEYSNISSNKAMTELESTEDICLRIMVSEAKNIKGRTNMEVKVIEHLFVDLKIYQLLLSISASAGSSRPIWLR